MPRWCGTAAHGQGISRGLWGAGNLALEGHLAQVCQRRGKKVAL